MIGALGRSEQLDGEMVDDMRSAISEACNNVVVHPYPAAPGPMVFSLTLRGDWIEAVVRDQGCGIRPGVVHNHGLGMGVSLINSLADRAEFESSRLGTEVRMRFRRLSQAPQRFSRLSLAALTLTDPESSAALRARSN